MVFLDHEREGVDHVQYVFWAGACHVRHVLRFSAQLRIGDSPHLGIAALWLECLRGGIAL